MSARRLIFRSFQCPGDIVMLTAAVRDLHKAHPGKFVVDVRTTAMSLWENNLHLTPLKDGDPGVQVLEMQYPAIHQSNFRPYHFIHGYAQFLEERLGVRIPVTEFKGAQCNRPQPPYEDADCAKLNKRDGHRAMPLGKLLWRIGAA